MDLPISFGFVGLNLKSQILTKKTHQNENTFNVYEAFQLKKPQKVVLGQKPPGQKTPFAKTPQTKSPRQNILFRNYGKKL